MLNLLHSFTDEVNKRDHLTSLLTEVFITVHIKTHDESYYLSIKDGKITLENLTIDHVDARIKCDIETLKSIIFGEVKLREACRLQSIELQANFKTTLFLETLFVLSMSHLKVSPQA